MVCLSNFCLAETAWCTFHSLPITVWNASKTKNYTVVSDSVYLGPLNAIAIEKIAEAVTKVG